MVLKLSSRFLLTNAFLHKNPLDEIHWDLWSPPEKKFFIKCACESSIWKEHRHTTYILHLATIEIQVYHFKLRTLFLVCVFYGIYMMKICILRKGQDLKRFIFSLGSNSKPYPVTIFICKLIYVEMFFLILSANTYVFLTDHGFVLEMRALSKLSKAK